MDRTPDFELEAHLAAINRDGYTIIESLLDEGALDAVRARIERYLGRYRGRTDFEGLKTERIYTLVARGKLFEDIAEDPRILAIADRVLAPNYLLSVSQAINIHPGEKPQGFHRDSGGYALPVGSPATLGMILAIDPFTEENGATEMFPGSHKWTWDEIAEFNKALGDPEAMRAFDGRLRKTVMPAGACVVFVGTMVHRGGANHSSAPRMALTNQYCEGYLRTQESFHLSIPPERVRAMSDRLQRLLGYGMRGSVMGSLTGMNPARALEDDYVAPVVADDRALGIQ